MTIIVGVKDVRHFCFIVQGVALGGFGAYRIESCHFGVAGLPGLSRRAAELLWRIVAAPGYDEHAALSYL